MFSFLVVRQRVRQHFTVPTDDILYQTKNKLIWQLLNPCKQYCRHSDTVSYWTLNSSHSGMHSRSRLPQQVKLLWFKKGIWSLKSVLSSWMQPINWWTNEEKIWNYCSVDWCVCIRRILFLLSLACREHLGTLIRILGHFGLRFSCLQQHKLL